MNPKEVAKFLGLHPCPPVEPEWIRQRMNVPMSTEPIVALFVKSVVIHGDDLKANSRDRIQAWWQKRFEAAKELPAEEMKALFVDHSAETDITTWETMVCDRRAKHILDDVSLRTDDVPTAMVDLWSIQVIFTELLDCMIEWVNGEGTVFETDLPSLVDSLSTGVGKGIIVAGYHVECSRDTHRSVVKYKHPGFLEHHLLSDLLDILQAKKAGEVPERLARCAVSDCRRLFFKSTEDNEYCSGACNTAAYRARQTRP